MTTISLHDYLQQLVQNIEDKKINLGTTLAELETYGEWRQFCEQEPGVVCTIAADPEEGLQMLRELAQNPKLIFEFIAQGEGKNLGIVTDGDRVLMQSYPTEAVTEARKQAYSSLIDEHQQKVADAVRRQRKITRGFFEKYQKKLFEWAPEKQPEIAKEIKQAERAAGLKTFEELRTQTIRRTRKLVGEEHVKEVELLIDAYAPEMTVLEVERPIRIAQEVTRVVLENPDITEPEIVYQSVENGLDKEKAIGYARVYSTMSHIQKHPEVVPKIITEAFPNVPQGAAQAALVHKLENVAGDESFVGKVMLRLGKSVASDTPVRNFIREGASQLGQKTSGAGSVATGFVSEIFGPKNDEVFASYIAASMKHPGKPFNFMEYLVILQYQQNPQDFRRNSSGFLEWAGKIGLGKTAAGAVAKLTAKELGAKVLTGIGLKALAGTVIAGPFGTVVALFADKILALGGKIIAGTINYIGSLGPLSTIFQGKPASLTDTLVLFPIILIAAVVILFTVPILPFLNFADFPQTVRNTALVAPMEGGIGQGQTGAPIDCTKPPDQGGPACILTQCEGDCQWPLDSSSGACIIEGPFVGTHSNCRLSGIDFISLGGQDKLFGATVYTPFAGTIERAVFGYLDNSGYGGNQDGGTYGNHVIVATDNGGHLLFAHLRNIQLVQQGQHVTAKTPVGFVDHTGYSLGVHLHYEDWGVGCPRQGVDINKYTPFPVPPCKGYADCQAKLQSAGHAACL